MYVYDLHLLVTDQVFDDTRAVLSLGKLCEGHGNSFESTSGQKPYLIKKPQDNTMQHRESRPYRCSGLFNQIFQLFYEYILNSSTAGLNGRYFYAKSHKHTK